MSHKKCAVYLPGTADEQASAQNKREKKSNGYNARLEETLSALTPFPTSAVTLVTARPSPFLSTKRNTIQTGEAQVWLEPDGSTPSTELIQTLLTLELDAVNLPCWSYDLVVGGITNCLKSAF